MRLRHNRSGKVVTIFLVIIGILLISLTAISIFFFQKEIERRKMTEIDLTRAQNTREQLQVELEEVKKKNGILQEKNKELDEKINSLLDELELEKGLRKETKSENAQLLEKIDVQIKEKEEVRDRLTKQLEENEQKIVELEAKLKVEENKRMEAELELKKLKEQQSRPNLRSQAGSTGAQSASAQTDSSDQTEQGPGQNKTSEKADAKVELDQIVVTPNKSVDADVGLEPMTLPDAQPVATPQDIPEGRVVSVDIETGFIVINLGKKDNLANGMYLSIYRGSDYLGDVKVTRVQTQMSAADIVPPLSSQMIRKNDQVVAK